MKNIAFIFGFGCLVALMSSTASAQHISSGKTQFSSTYHPQVVVKKQVKRPVKRVYIISPSRNKMVIVKKQKPVPKKMIIVKSPRSRNVVIKQQMNKPFISSSQKKTIVVKKQKSAPHKVLARRYR